LGKAKRHPVDGEWMTVQDAAEMLGLKRQQLYQLMNTHQCGLQMAVNLVREGLALGGQGRADRHMVDGRWTTVRQLAEQLGTNPVNLRCWRYRHCGPDGRPASLQQVADAYRAGLSRGGSAPVAHTVNGRTMTTTQVAKKYGVRVTSVRARMSAKQCSLAACVRHYEQKRRRRAEKQARQAEKEILRILGY